MGIISKNSNKIKFYSSFFFITGISLALLLVSPSFQHYRLKVFNLFASFSSNTIKLSQQDQQSEIETLRNQVAYLSLSLIQKEEQIKSLSGFREQFSADRIPSIVPASILVRRDISPNRRTLVIDKGSINSIKMGSAVFFGHSLLGRVIEVSPHTSRVMHITDPAFRVKVTLIGFSGDKIKDYGEAVCAGQNHSYCSLNLLEKNYQKWDHKEISVLVSGKPSEDLPWFTLGTVTAPDYVQDKESLDAGNFWNLKVNIIDIDQIRTVLVLVEP
ncbi:MAG: rod shape-determining protein MreC [Candidatus Brocadiae bacterium]|nr:rod shape-determining protein MreC [Candidatus Brocadiia bacterium]